MTKKIMTGILAVLLTAGIILTGCAKRPESVEELAGAYECRLDLKDTLSERIAKAISGAGEDVDFKFRSSIDYVMTLDLKKDKTYELKVNTKAFADSLADAFDKQGEEFVKALFKAMGISEDSLSKEDIEGFTKQMREEFAKSMTEQGLDSAGTFTYENGKLSLNLAETGEIMEGTVDKKSRITLKSEDMEKALGEEEIVFTRK